jgi:RHS repeat-associated protein
MKRNKIRLAFGFFFAAISLTCAWPVSAQVATGSPPFGSYGGGPDTINLANLNAHIDVPVLWKAGRGMPFTYDLTYDSSIWTPVTSGTTKVWQPAENWGWGASTQVEVGSVSVNIQLTVECGFWKQLGGGNEIWISQGNIYNYSNWAFVDRFGVSHPFSGSATQYTGTSGTCAGTNTSINALTSDGSGYTLQVTAGSTATVIARNGTTSNPPINSGIGSATKTDRNGNQISVSTAGVFTDTLGVTALTAAGAAPNPITFTYTAPSGANASYTMKFATYTVQTNFGCTGVTEYTASSTPLVSEIDLPDGTKYLFSYEPTYQNSANVTGRLASVTLPTGGTISYSYGAGGVNGITCGDGSALNLNRTTPDGTWTYAHSESGTAWTTLVTDPQSNQTTINFQGIYETERQAYQGSTSGTLLKTTTVCYNGNTTSCNSTAISLPISRRTIVTQWPGTSGLQSKTDVFYNNYGLTTERDNYAYGAGAPGSLTAKTVTAYASLGNGIFSQPSSVTVYDGNSNIKSQTTYSYDQGTVTTTSGTPQHISITGSRGNLTTASYLVQGTTTLSRTYSYYDTGTVNAAKDVNGAQTTYTYGASSCGNSFVTSVSEPLSLAKSMTWNCTGGIQLSVTDENSKTTSSSYTDPYFWRPNSVTDAASDVATFAYTGASQVEAVLPLNGSSSAVDVLTVRDALGRVGLSQVREAPGSSTFDTIETDYDNDGRPNRTTLPFSGPADTVNYSAPAKATEYDALGRKAQVTDNDLRTVGFSYSQNDTLRTLGPPPTGENAKRKQFEYDSLGRLTSVCEITTLTGSGTCGQTASATGYWTKYTYDAASRLTGVTQNAQSSSSQTRSYAYDDLGRMTSETNPESGTTSYVYDSDSACGTSSGDLVKKTDAVGNITCEAYDALHRPTSVTYSGPYSGVTPNKYFVYDAATVNGVVMSNVKSRTAEAYTATCSTCTKISDIGLSYSVLGQPSDVYESTPHSTVYYHTAATYWANGVINHLTGPPTYSLTYNLDGEGRVYSTTAGGQNPLTSTTYNPASLPLQITFGSSDSDTLTYDQNSNRMTQYKFTVNGQSVVGSLTWNPIGTLEDLVVTDPFYSAGNQSCAYTHDDLSRVASANCGSPWSQTFSYDAFGNINKSGTSSFQASYSYLTNRMTEIGSSTPSYDANGNVTNDFLHTYSWDAAGRPVTVDGVGITYDALGRMVEQNRSSAYTQLAYSPTGFKMVILNGQTALKSFAPLPGGAMALYVGSAMYYLHSDWVGSSRFASTTSRTMYFDAAYGPFGEPYAESGTPYLSFTGMNQDIVSNLYDFPAREYGIQGRWPSADPAGISAVRLRDPQTLNRYAYVRNSPLHMVDPTGMCPTEVDSPVGVDTGDGNDGGVASAARGARHAADCEGDDPSSAPQPGAPVDQPVDPNQTDPNQPDPSQPDPTQPAGQPDPSAYDPNNDPGNQSPLCTDSSGNPSSCNQGPPAPGQPFPINCIANCNGMSAIQLLMQSQAASSNECVASAAMANNADPDQDTNKRMQDFGQSLVECDDKYPLGVLY